jgi:DNA-binding response OmpR family regulator
VPANASRRKVLIVEDEPAIRNVLFVLLAGLGCDGDVAHDTRQALSMIRKESFDAVLLDLRSAHLPPEEMVSSIVELRPSLVGRVLVIIGEVADPETMEMLTRCALPHIQRSHVASDLWAGLRSLPGFAPSAAETPSR